MGQKFNGNPYDEIFSNGKCQDQTYVPICTFSKLCILHFYISYLV